MDSFKVIATISASVSIKDNEYQSGEEVTQIATEELYKIIIDWMEHDIRPTIEYKYEMASEHFNNYEANKLTN